MTLQDWCSNRRGYPVVAVITYGNGCDEYTLSDGRRWLEANDYDEWLPPLPRTDAAHEWAAHLKIEAAPKREGCPICGHRLTKEPYVCCGEYHEPDNLIVVVE